jgi:hypothetical protein
MTASYGAVLGRELRATYYVLDLHYANCFQGRGRRRPTTSRSATGRARSLDYIKEHVTRLPVVMAACRSPLGLVQTR